MPAFSVAAEVSLADPPAPEEDPYYFEAADYMISI